MKGRPAMVFPSDTNVPFQWVRWRRRGAVRVLHHLFVVGFATVAVAAWLPSRHGVLGEPGPSHTPESTAQAAAEQDQQPDTLELLRARIRGLESALGESEARVARLADSLTDLHSRTERDRAERNLEIAELRGTLLSLFDSLGILTDMNSRNESNILSLRAEGEARSGALATRLDSLVDGLADALDGMETDMATWRAQVLDSLRTARDAIATEQERRRTGDSRSVLWAVFAAGAVLSVVGVAWWRARAGTVAVDSRVEAMRFELDRKIARAEEALTGSSTGEASELLREQLAALERTSATLAALEEARAADGPHTPEPDHNLALGVCNELNRIENNLLAMDSKVRGHKQLRGCVRRIKENLHVEGYEITELRGRRYGTGMRVDADLVEDESLDPGQRLISRVNRPEVRFRNSIIQSAAVKVSVGF